MHKKINITDAELEIMRIIWAKDKTTSNEIIQELEDKKEWKASTIKTLLSRLCTKGIINFDKKGKEYYYYPLVTQEDYSNAESQSFLDKMFNGSINLMLINFVKNKGLSKNDVDELKSILNNTDNEEV